MNFVLKSTGSKGEVTEDDINDTENIPNRVQELQDEFQEVCEASISIDYILTKCSSRLLTIPSYLKLKAPQPSDPRLSDSSKH